ncbi:hypothetical protein AGMMS50233_02380 [Endomicrobiia bacterium]|nr:hypothetical protein AGMMS50233_02380 [Endomicrobiia bacterium]
MRAAIVLILTPSMDRYFDIGKRHCSDFGVENTKKSLFINTKL